MKRMGTAVFGLLLIMAAPAGAATAWEGAMVSALSAIQDTAFLTGICEKQVSKEELAALRAFLDDPPPSWGAAGVKMMAETRKAFEDGRAQAERRNWGAGQCDRALTASRERQERLMKAVDRIEAAERR